MLNVVWFGRQIKVQYCDRSGWCVWAKRLEAGQFIADWSKARTREIDCTGLKMLLEGIQPRRCLKRYVKRDDHARSGDRRDEHHPSHSGTNHRGQGTCWRQ